MALIKTSLLVFHFLFFLHLSPISRSILLASVVPNQDNLPIQIIESKPNGHAFVGKSRELAVVAKKGGGGRGGGGGGRGGGGGGRGVIPITIAGSASHHRGNHSSNERELAIGWLGLLAFIGLVFYLLEFVI